MRLAPAARVLLAVLLAGGVPHHPAMAENTILRLSETATVMATPDSLAASLRVEAPAPTAQEAQRRVNDAMRDAIAAAKKVDGIAVSTSAYAVWRTSPNPADRNERWQAAQSLDLTGKDAEAMLKLIGDLQQKGLAQSSLVWRLSRETERQARKDATKQALSALRGRAEDAADILGMRFDSFREVRLDSVTPPPIMPRQAMMARAAAAPPSPPPAAETEDIPVTATAEADVLLKPR